VIRPQYSGGNTQSSLEIGAWRNWDSKRVGEQRRCTRPEIISIQECGEENSTALP
jgi:hypothetical protein